MLYQSEGYIKKFPLKKKSITIGREEDNDLVIDDEFISRHHIKLKKEGNGIKIQDLDSSNGTFVKTDRIQRAELRPGDSFSIGGVEIFLKEGSLEEFKISNQLTPVFNGISKDNKQKFRPPKTKMMVEVYNNLLKQIMYSGLRHRNFTDFLSDLSEHLSGMKQLGSFFLLSQPEGEINILLSVKRDTSQNINILEQVLKQKDIFKRELPYHKIPGTGFFAHSMPFCIDTQNILLLYISSVDQTGEKTKIISFLKSLKEEILLFSRLLGKGKREEKKQVTDEEVTDFPDSMESTHIIASSQAVKELVEKSKMMARSDIFVLIQGESGTGKELFARMIHRHSRRRSKPFIALNCASIPENLLESEFFGYEKGAFTGAYTSKKGKLEMASGGTLVLDEIGDMPLNLQSKLLRALQENEFFRLGGIEPIKVDLRIISMTNREIGKLIKSGEFRKDLYFRLVHRVINIPPLRQRKEDISVLINFFTNKFCHESGKTITGYSLKAFKILQDYDWVGNVRELENEVRSIISMIEDGEMVSHELISEEIKSSLHDQKKTVESSAEEPRTEKDIIIMLLEKNGWNQSKTARQMKMSYWGFHKKIKRLGITIPAKKITS